MQVKLIHFSEDHINDLHSFELPEDQKRFTALPKDIAKVDDGQYRVIIHNGEEPVGFFLLHSTERVKEYSDNPNAMLLTAFSINYKQQSKGYAKYGMLALRDFVHNEFPSCNEIVLAVNHKNVPAQRLYEKVGFQDTGERRIGPIGEQYVMKIFLNE